MQFDRKFLNSSLNSSSVENGQNKVEPTCQAPNNIPVKSSTEISTPVGPSRFNNSQQLGLKSLFSSRQRKASSGPALSTASVRQSRLICVAKIDESIQAIDDLFDFHNRAVKAENKVSNALWHTVQYSKPRKSDSGSRNGSQAIFAGSQLNVHGSHGEDVSSSGNNTAVDSGISEMATENSPLPRSNGLQGSSVLMAKRYLQCFVDANESRAKIATCRASFHKKITCSQLQMVSETLQRLRSLYIEHDTKLETYSSQLEADVRECWRKYAKCADNVTRLRSKLKSLLPPLEEIKPSKRKAIESSVNDLDGATTKLHMAHNTYTLSLITARQYHQWLVTRLQPCLYRNLYRCLRLADYAVSYLLRLARIDQTPRGAFDFIALPDADPLGDTKLDVGLNDGIGSSGEDTFRRAFPFDLDLIVRAGDDALQPDKIIVNPMTTYHVQKLLQNHLQEVSNQGNITQVLEAEHAKLVDSLTTWISVLSSGSKFRDLPTTLKTDEAMSLLLEEVEPLSPLEPPPRGSAIDAEKMFLGAASKPATLCALAIQLGTCEFFHCQSICFADSHAQIVQVLRQAEVVAPSPSPLPSSLTTISASGISSTNLLSAAPSLTSALTGDGSAAGVGTTGLDILESRFHCLRVQLDNQLERKLYYAFFFFFLLLLLLFLLLLFFFFYVQGRDRSASAEARSSVGESDSENDVSSQRPTAVGQTTTQPSLIQGGDDDDQVPRRVLKSNKEESNHHSSVSFIKSPGLTLADNRSPGRHSAIRLSGGKSLQRFHPNRLFRKDVSSPSNVAAAASVASINNAVLLSRADSTSSIDHDQKVGVAGSMSTESMHQIRSISIDSSGRKIDQEDVDISKEPWFHGVLPRSEVVRLLQHQGDFLVRETSKAASPPHLRHHHHHRHRGTFVGPSAAQSTEELFSNAVVESDGKVVVTKMVLSVYWNGHKHFFIQGGNEAAEGSGVLGNRRGGWSFEEYEFPTLRDLIEYHMRTGKPITQSSGAVLLNPISRPDWQLDNRDVILLEKIGQGNFGEVHRGIYNGREVAVKMCRAGPAEVEIRRKFLEGETTALNFFHPNIVRLLGIAVRSHPIMIVMEYVAGGSLLSFLRRHGETADIRLLLRMCVDAASGMAYLESKNCIHRDLAARNCLLTEDRVLKIADFGMAREEQVYHSSDRNGPIPIKWTAPEAFYSNRYTSKCDVWSFGVLLWEIFSGGDTPYPRLTNSETRDLVENGYRLTTPDRMPRQLGKYMQSCWHQNPSRRPNFGSLVISLTQLKREFCETSELSSPSDSGILSSPRQQPSKSALPPTFLEFGEATSSSCLTTPVITPSESQPTLNSRLPRTEPRMTPSEEDVNIKAEKLTPSNASTPDPERF
ncbi:hypothetical protein Aperf_G00000113258 [Anoplocephala perfoliata]